MFEQLALVDHPNIVKLHKYWLDASEARARVSRQRPPGWDAATGGWGGCGHPQVVEPAHLAGRLHHRVRVVRQPQAIPQKNQEEPQGHERQGMGRGLGRRQGQDGVGCRLGQRW